MRLSLYFNCPRTIENYYNNRFGFIFDHLSEWLRMQGYTRNSVRSLFCITAKFGDYLDELEVTTSLEASAEHVQLFFEEYGYADTSKLKLFRRYLAEIFPNPAPPVVDTLPEEYGNWLKEVRYCTSGTRRVRLGYLRRYFAAAKIRNIEAYVVNSNYKTVQADFLKSCQGRSKSFQRSLQATLRTFFEFCYATGRTQNCLATSIPPIRTYRLSETPRGFDEQTAYSIVAAVRDGSRTSLRDRAILLLLYHYGIRAQQVVDLKLSDIDWEKELISFRGIKKGRDVVQPLIREFTEALFRYLKEERPSTTSENVFIRVVAPHTAFKDSRAVSALVRVYVLKSGVDCKISGAHGFRHGFASRMLTQGNSLKSIADALGHTSLSSAVQYTKVDLSLLSQMPLPVPGRD